MLNASPKEDNRLPDCASKRMIRLVRQELRRYGIVPVNPLWRFTWEWASGIADSYLFGRHLPSSSGEIACQYVVLLLATIKNEEGRCFKLPTRAGRCVPKSVAAILPPGAGDKLLAIERRILDSLPDDLPAMPVPLVLDVK